MRWILKFFTGQHRDRGKGDRNGLLCLPAFSALLIVLATILFGSSSAHAWPADGDWIPLYNSSGFMGDNISDASGQNFLELVGDDTHPLAYIFTDDTTTRLSLVWILF